MNLENNLNNLNRDEFISLFRVIFEKTQWIAEKLFELKPFKDGSIDQKSFLGLSSEKRSPVSCPAGLCSSLSLSDSRDPCDEC